MHGSILDSYVPSIDGVVFALNATTKRHTTLANSSLLDSSFAYVFAGGSSASNRYNHGRNPLRRSFSVVFSSSRDVELRIVALWITLIEFIRIIGSKRYLRETRK
jgi:hypothetical protein